MHRAQVVRQVMLFCALGGSTACTSTASRELVISISNYDARSREAIDAVERIERSTLEQVEAPPAHVDQQFLAAMLDPRLDLAHGDGVRMVERRVHPFVIRVDVGDGVTHPLDEMRCSHARFVDTFDQVQQAGIFGKKAVASSAPQFLDLLLAQQIALAKLVSGPARAELKSRKTALLVQMIGVRDSKRSDADKGEALLALRASWLVVERDEKQLTDDAVEQLVKAAATGAALRKQLLAYGKWSMSDLTDSAKGLTAFIASTGMKDDAAGLDGRIEDVRQGLERDPRLAQAARTLLAGIAVPARPGALANPGAAALAAVGSTPCLDSLQRSATAQEAGHGG